MSKKNDFEKESIKNEKGQIKFKIEELQDEITEFSSALPDTSILFPSMEELGRRPEELNYEVYDYASEIEKIKEECKETLECLSSLYINSESLQKKNIHNIVKNDADILSDLKLALFTSKRTIIILMKQIDMGATDPELFISLATFQKEIRETIKTSYELQKKMKDFYKELKTEEQTLIKGGESANNDIQIEKVGAATDVRALAAMVDEMIAEKTKRKKD